MRFIFVYCAWCLYLCEKKNVMGFEAKVVVVCDTKEEFVNRVERGVFDLAFCRVPADCPKDADQANARAIVDAYWHSVLNAILIVRDGGYICVNNVLPMDDIRVGLYFNKEIMTRYDVCSVAKVEMKDCKFPTKQGSLVTIFRKLSRDEIVYRNHSLHDLGLMNESKRKGDKRWIDFKCAYMRVHTGFEPIGCGVLPFIKMYPNTGLGLYMFYKDMIRAFSNEGGAVVDLGGDSVYLAEKCVEMGRKVCIVRKDRHLIDNIKGELGSDVLEALRLKEECDNIPSGCYNVSECLSVSIRNMCNKEDSGDSDQEHTTSKSTKRRAGKTKTKQPEEASHETGYIWINDNGDKVSSPYGEGWHPDRVEKREYQSDFSDIPF